MKTQSKIEKKGYSVTYNFGHRDGDLTIVSVTAKKNGREVTAENITKLLKKI